MSAVHRSEGRLEPASSALRSEVETVHTIGMSQITARTTSPNARAERVAAFCTRVRWFVAA